MKKKIIIISLIIIIAAAVLFLGWSYIKGAQKERDIDNGTFQIRPGRFSAYIRYGYKQQFKRSILKTVKLFCEGDICQGW